MALIANKVNELLNKNHILTLCFMSVLRVFSLYGFIEVINFEIILCVGAFSW